MPTIQLPRTRGGGAAYVPDWLAELAPKATAASTVEKTTADLAAAKTAVAEARAALEAVSTRTYEAGVPQYAPATTSDYATFHDARASLKRAEDALRLADRAHDQAVDRYHADVIREVSDSEGLETLHARLRDCERRAREAWQELNERLDERDNLDRVLGIPRLGMTREASAIDNGTLPSVYRAAPTSPYDRRLHRRYFDELVEDRRDAWIIRERKIGHRIEYGYQIEKAAS